MKIDAWACEHCETIYANEDSMKECNTACTDVINTTILDIEYVAYIASKLIDISKTRFNKYLRISFWRPVFYKDLRTIIWSEKPYIDPTEYAGWAIDVEGTISPHAYRGDTQCSFYDLFKSPLMKCFTIESYNTKNEKFKCTLKIYLNDFPKLKKSYNIYKELKEKKIPLNNLELKNSMKKATNDVVYKNDKIINLKAMVSFFRTRLKQTERLIDKTKKELEKSDKYIDAYNVLVDYENDSCKLETIINNFETVEK